MPKRRKRAAAKPVLEWVGRASVRRDSIATYRRWRSKCYQFAVVQIDSTIDDRRRWLAVRCWPIGEYVLSRHKSASAAKKACERQLVRNRRLAHSLEREAKRKRKVV